MIVKKGSYAKFVQKPSDTITDRKLLEILFIFELYGLELCSVR